MKIWLNDLEIAEFIESEATLGVLLASVQNQHIPADHVISEIWIDDEPLTSERLTAWKDRPISEFSETRILAPHRRALAVKGIRLVAAGLAQSQEQLQSIGDSLAQGKTGEAMHTLLGYVSVWNGVQQTVESVCRLLGKNLNELHESLHLSDHFGRLSEQLQELKNALQAGDMVLIGDLLNYEFKDMTHQWEKILNDLADHVAA